MRNTINYKTIPCNIKNYDVIEAFENLKYIDWRQNLNDIKKNDIVYIYISAPYSQIKYKCKVNKVNKNSTTIDDRKYWNNLEEYGKFKRYMELELIESYDDNEFLKYENLKNNDFKNVQSQATASDILVSYIEKVKHINQYSDDQYDVLNKKRVNDKETWIKILNNEALISNNAMDILRYLYDCKNYTSNGKSIADYFNTEVLSITNYITLSSRKIIDYLNLPKQIRKDGTQRLWNIFFETVPELNQKNIFTWKLRKELVEALAEKFELIIKEDESINEKIKQFINENPYETFMNSIQKELEARVYFVNKFSLNKIVSMSLDDFVIGKAGIDEKGRDTFCYLIERTMQNLGDMRGSVSKKFGVYYSVEEKTYKYAKKYGNSLSEAFENLKKEIIQLLVSANNNDYESINHCEIANIFKGKILSTYFPEKYLCIFDESDLDKFLNLLEIKYDVHIINTPEKKKELLKQYKENNELLKKYSDYYFVIFLYKTFNNELKIQHTVSGEIDYDIQFVDFDYVKKHESISKNNYRSRNIDYEKINRNKKDVGNRGENAILNYEIRKLKSLGLNDLAEQVHIEDNDAIGYDIVSYDENGKKMHIEVKTNSGNKKYLDFYISDNELQHLIDEDNYYIYYLFDIQHKPKCHIINKKDILARKDDFFQPVIYKVNVDVAQKQIL